MVSHNPKDDNGLFGDLFDLNGDSKTDAAEAALMFMMFHELAKEDKEKQSQHPENRTVDIDDMDIDGI